RTARGARVKALERDAVTAIEQVLLRRCDERSRAPLDKLAPYGKANERGLHVRASQPPRRIETVVDDHRRRISTRLFAAAARLHSPAVRVDATSGEATDVVATSPWIRRTSSAPFVALRNSPTRFA